MILKSLGLSETDGMSNTFPTRERTEIICVPSCARTFFILRFKTVRAHSRPRKKNLRPQKKMRTRVRAQKNRPPM